MSYILDALRKSEVERQRAAEQTEAKSGIRLPQPPKYAASKRLPFMVGVVFLVVSSIAAFIVMRAENMQESKNIVEQSVVRDTKNINNNAASNNSQLQKKNTLQTYTELKEFEELPFFWEKPVAYRQGIDPFSVSIHVFASDPSQRILFINNKEYRAGEQTQQGPRIESIEPQGVILSYRGEYFKLPRPR